VTERLLPLDFVSGIGPPGAGFTIYLKRQLSADEKQQVESAVSAAAPGKPVRFVVTGEFRAR